MIINDKVYGKIKITEPVLIELIKSKPLQRLKGINQGGVQFVVRCDITRYEHCVGVMLLLRKFGAPLEEQIAGLLHDVPHTAFSHTVDFVFGKGQDQTFHENFLRKVIFDSEIPSILKKYRFEVERVIDDENFPLLEQPLPELCADRIDYFLRHLVDERVGGTQLFLSHLKVIKDRFAIDDQQVAKKYARAFMDRNIKSWASPVTLAAFNILAKTIRRGLDIGLLKESDLFKDDNFVTAKLNSSTDKQIQFNLKLLTPQIKLVIDQEEYDFIERGKVRFVDPSVNVGGKLKKLSTLEPEFKKEIKNFIKYTKAGHKIKILGVGKEKAGISPTS